MDKKIICIAGKNNIAVDVAQYIRHQYPEFTLVACCNTNDTGNNSFQRSFRNFCDLNNIPIVELKDLYSIVDLIFLSLEYDKIIKTEFFSSTRLFNIHFSYLPEYKGMYTSALPILNGETYTGVTLHKIDSGIDTGDIISQQKIILNEEVTAEKLYSMYIDYGSRLVISKLQELIYNDFTSHIQPGKLSTYYSKKAIDYGNIIINLNKTAYEISKQIRAFVFPAYQLPKVFGYEIYDGHITDVKSTVKAGTLLKDDEFSILVSSIDYDIRLLKDLRKNLFDFTREGNLNSLKYYIDKGYDIFQRSEEGWDLAIIAAYNGRYAFLEYLIENLNWDVNTKNNNGTTLTMYLMTYCSKNNEPAMLENYLKKYIPQKDQIDFSGNNIVYYTEKYNNFEVIQIIKNYFK